MGLDQFSERVIFQDHDQLNDLSPVGVWTLDGSATFHDGRIDVIQILNSDTIGHNIGLDFLNVDGSSPIGVVLVPARAGYDANPALDFLAQAMPAAYHYVLTQNVFQRAWFVGEAIGAGQLVTINYSGGTF